MYERVVPDGADKRRWGVPLYLGYGSHEGWRFPIEHHGFTHVEDDIYSLNSYYAYRFAWLAKLAVRTEQQVWSLRRLLWVT